MRIFNRKLSLMLVLAVVMLGLLATLATLQYRWLGQISQAENDRMKRNLTASALSFSQDFDREVTHAFTLFQLTNEHEGSTDLTPQLAQRVQIWQKSALHPELISDLYLVSKTEKTEFQLSRFNSEESKLVSAAWTNELKSIQTKLQKRYLQQQEQINSKQPTEMSAEMDVIEPNIPALIIPIAPEFSILLRTPSPVERVPFHGVSNYVIVKLNKEFINNELIPNLSRKYFSGSNGLDYNVTVINNANQSVLYHSSTDSQQQNIKGDVNASLFRIRLEEFPIHLYSKSENMKVRSTAIWQNRIEQDKTGNRSEVVESEKPITHDVTTHREQNGKVSMRVVNKSQKTDFIVNTFVEEAPVGNWALIVRHRTGSLETFVANTRRQNLLISFGILILLAASVSLIVIATRRSQLLAQRQIEFVSSVSHEFRTPLAVICSAGENMADGIVESQKHVEKYGKLVLDEGRKLTEMVEQILEFAGANGKQRQLELRPITIKEVIDDALSACQPLLKEKDFTVETEINSDLPLIEGDSRSLSRAIQNLINNAIKYDDGERWIRLSAYETENQNRNEVVIKVADRGRGIESDEIKNIFEPFYRGRDVVAEQIHGNGLGLSLVKQTVSAHKGRVSVKSDIGQGSEFSIHLPIALKETSTNEDLSHNENKIQAYSDGV